MLELRYRLLAFYVQQLSHGVKKEARSHIFLIKIQSWGYTIELSLYK